MPIDFTDTSSIFGGKSSTADGGDDDIIRQALNMAGAAEKQEAAAGDKELVQTLKSDEDIISQALQMAGVGQEEPAPKKAVKKLQTPKEYDIPMSTPEMDDAISNMAAAEGLATEGKGMGGRALWHALSEGGKDIHRNLSHFLRGVHEAKIANYKGMPNVQNKLRKSMNGDMAVQMANYKWLRPDMTFQRSDLKDPLSRYVYDFTRMIPQQTAQIAGSLLTRGAFSTPFMFTQIAGADMQEMKRRGVSPTETVKYAFINAAGQSLLETAGMMPALKALSPAGKTMGRMRRIMSGGLGEFTTEFLQKFPELITHSMAVGKANGLSNEEIFLQIVEGLDDAAIEGIYEGLVALPFGAIGGVPGKTASEIKFNPEAFDTEALQNLSNLFEKKFSEKQKADIAAFRKDPSDVAVQRYRQIQDELLKRKKKIDVVEKGGEKEAKKVIEEREKEEAESAPKEPVVEEPVVEEPTPATPPVEEEAEEPEVTTPDLPSFAEDKTVDPIGGDFGRPFVQEEEDIEDDPERRQELIATSMESPGAQKAAEEVGIDPLRAEIEGEEQELENYMNAHQELPEGPKKTRRQNEDWQGYWEEQKKKYGMEEDEDIDQGKALNFNMLKQPAVQLDDGTVVQGTKVKHSPSPSGSTQDRIVNGKLIPGKGYPEIIKSFDGLEKTVIEGGGTMKNSVKGFVVDNTFIPSKMISGALLRKRSKKTKKPKIDLPAIRSQKAEADAKRLAKHWQGVQEKDEAFQKQLTQMRNVEPSSPTNPEKSLEENLFERWVGSMYKVAGGQARTGTGQQLGKDELQQQAQLTLWQHLRSMPMYQLRRLTKESKKGYKGKKKQTNKMFGTVKNQLSKYRMDQVAKSRGVSRRALDDDIKKGTYRNFKQLQEDQAGGEADTTSLTRFPGSAEEQAKRTIFEEGRTEEEETGAVTGSDRTLDDDATLSTEQARLEQERLDAMSFETGKAAGPSIFEEIADVSREKRNSYKKIIAEMQIKKVPKKHRNKDVKREEEDTTKSVEEWDEADYKGILDVRPNFGEEKIAPPTPKTPPKRKEVLVNGKQFWQYPSVAAAETALGKKIYNLKEEALYHQLVKIKGMSDEAAALKVWERRRIRPMLKVSNHYFLVGDKPVVKAKGPNLKKVELPKLKKFEGMIFPDPNPRAMKTPKQSKAIRDNMSAKRRKRTAAYKARKRKQSLMSIKDGKVDKVIKEPESKRSKVKKVVEKKKKTARKKKTTMLTLDFMSGKTAALEARAMKEVQEKIAPKQSITEQKAAVKKHFEDKKKSLNIDNMPVGEDGVNKRFKASDIAELELAYDRVMSKADEVVEGKEDMTDKQKMAALNERTELSYKANKIKDAITILKAGGVNVHKKAKKPTKKEKKPVFEQTEEEYVDWSQDDVMETQDDDAMLTMDSLNEMKPEDAAQSRTYFKDKAEAMDDEDLKDGFINNEKGETVIIGELAKRIINSGKAWKKGVDNLIDHLSIEAAFDRIDANNTGIAAKTLHSRIDSSIDRGFQDQTKLMSIVHKSFKGHGKKITDQDLGEIVLMAEASSVEDYLKGIDSRLNAINEAMKKEKLKGKKADEDRITRLATDLVHLDTLEKNPATINRYIEPAAWIRDYFDEAVLEFNKMGIRLDFKQRMLNTLRARIEETSDTDEMVSLNESIKRLKEMEFVHIPIKLWTLGRVNKYVSKTSKRDFMEEHARLKSELLMMRETITLHEMLMKGRIHNSQINPFEIIASYSRKRGMDKALALIRDAGIKDGMIKLLVKKPGKIKGVEGDWVEIHKKHQLSGIRPSNLPTKLRTRDGSGVKAKVWMHSLLKETIDSSFGVWEKQGKWGKSMAIIKMSSFFNPVFLPMYDMYQHAMAVGLRPIASFKAFKKAIHDVKNHTDDYYSALDNGLASKPFALPFSALAEAAKVMKFRAKAEGKVGRSFVGGSIAGGSIALWEEYMETDTIGAPVTKFTKGMFNAVYHPAWWAAWKMDETVRMATFNYLKTKGHTDMSAAQTAAIFHGDYANVPAKTRRLLNNFFFTPTFKIAMFKLWKNMVKNSGKFLYTNPNNMSKQERRLAYGLIHSVGLTVLRHILLTSVFDWEEDEFGRRYTREVETPFGPKELTITFSDPLNIPLRYIHRLNNVRKNVMGNIVGAVWNNLLWDLHPAFQKTSRLIKNFENDGGEIWNTLDSNLTKASKLTLYGARYIGIVESAYKKINPSRKQQMTVDKRNEEIGKFSLALTAFLSFYLRDIKTLRLKKELEVYKKAHSKFQREWNLSGNKKSNQKKVKQFKTHVDRLEAAIRAEQKARRNRKLEKKYGKRSR